MNEMPADDLKKIEDYLIDGRYDQARPLLADYIRRHPDDAQAWFLLSFVVPETSRQKECLERALKIDPWFSKARLRLNQFSSSPPPASSPPPSAPPEVPAEPDYASLEPKTTPNPRVSPFYDNDMSFTEDYSNEDQTQEKSWFEELQSAYPSESLTTSPTTTPLKKTLPESPTAPISPTAAPQPVDLSQNGAPPPGSAPETEDQPDLLPNAEDLVNLPPPEAPVEVKPGPSRDQKIWLWFGVIFFVVVFASFGVLYLGTLFVLPTPPPVVVLPPTITPTFTDTPTPTATAPATMTPIPTNTVTPLPTATPRPTATLVLPGATVIFQMQVIQKQVSDLRGLPIQGSVPGYIISKSQAESMLRAELMTADNQAKLANQARVLSILGLIKPTYDYVNLALNHVVDNLGGFYVPSSKNIFLLSFRFSGLERFIYSHEYDHALVDQKYSLKKLGMDPCTYDNQRCEALTALLEGDAELLMEQWLQQYASGQDRNDIISFIRPLMAIVPDTLPPPYVTKDVNFPYTQGRDFVKAIYKQGNWSAVNQVYARPPVSTEQILHPEKYQANEVPVSVNVPPYTPALGEGWSLIDNNVLGEWTTYLLLGYGADVSSQLDDTAAKTAAAGWGGDNYQVYYNQSTDQTALGAEWVWDTTQDGDEFQTALIKYLDQRYRGLTVSLAGNKCWQLNDQTSCVYSAGGKTLWLAAPDAGLLLIMQQQYPDFR